MFAPIVEPIIAAMTDGIAKRIFTRPLRINRDVASVVPQAEESLFVAIAAWGGSPAIKYAGREINQPPPPIASTSPAKNRSGHTMRKVLYVISIVLSL